MLGVIDLIGVAPADGQIIRKDDTILGRPNVCVELQRAKVWTDMENLNSSNLPT